jgi:hypothetical protein
VLQPISRSFLLNASVSCSVAVVSGFVASLDGLEDLRDLRSLLDRLEDLLVTGLEPEAHRDAAGLLHALEQRDVDRIDVGEARPARLQAAPDDLVAHRERVRLARREQVVGQVDLVEPARRELLHLVDHARGIAVADLGSDQLPAGAEDALERAAAARRHADRRANGLVARERREVARRDRERVHVDPVVAAAVALDLVPFAVGEPQHRLEAALAGHGVAQLEDHVLALAHRHDVELGVLAQRLLRAEAHVRSAHRGHHVGVDVLDVCDRSDRGVKRHRDRRRAHDVGPKVVHHRLELLPAVPAHDHVEHAHLVPAALERGREIADAERRRGQLGERVERIDEQEPHGACSSSLVWRGCNLGTA